MRGGSAVVALGCALVLAGSLSCSAPPRARSVVLITVDTWRADSFGAGGSPTVHTPHLDRFFRGATQFADAWAPAPTTLASHASMLTGLWPTEHGIPRNGWPLPQDIPTLAESLRKSGFATGAFVSSAALDAAFGLDRGFDVYDGDMTRAEARDQAWRPAHETLAAASAWWRGAPGRRFLWVHLFEPHFPYAPDPVDLARYDTGYRGPANGSMDFLFALWEDPSLLPPDARAHLLSLYHAEITGLDRALGDLLGQLAGDPKTLTLLTADHGESVGEHGLDFKHGPWVYDADVHVPLAVRGEGFPPAVSSATVRTVDAAQTFVSALGVRPRAAWESRDLREWVTSEVGLPAFSEASMPWNVERAGEYPNRHKQRAVRTRDWTLVETPWVGNRTEWFRRADDPGELGAPSPAPADGAALAAELADWIGRGRPRAEPGAIDPALAARLRSLGYVDGSSP